jgi:hypothetical protein
LMTDLRFGTETAQSPRVMIRSSASAGGRSAHRVTPVDLPRGCGACAGLLQKAKASLLAGAGGSSGRGRGRKPQGGRSRFTERLPGSVGDTLKCREVARSSVFGRSHRRRSKHMRGGPRPNDRIGTPRRGRRSREHRLGCALNRTHPRTDARPEQRPEVGHWNARADRRERQEGNGRREASRLVERERLWRPLRNPRGGVA